jgi:hypothetical protein
MKYLAYLNILFGDNHVQNSGNGKKGGCPPSRLENKKDKCSHLVIWTSTLTIIRIEKLLIIGN